MSRTKSGAKTLDDYFELVRKFPLRPIRNAAEHEAAGKVLIRLIGRERPLSTGESDYMEALAQLSKAYEEKLPRLTMRRMSSLEAVQFLMEQSKMNTDALGKILGSQPAASLFLTGKRPLSKASIFRLANHFKVEPAVFLEPPTAGRKAG